LAGGFLGFLRGFGFVVCIGYAGVVTVDQLAGQVVGVGGGFFYFFRVELIAVSAFLLSTYPPPLP